MKTTKPTTDAPPRLLTNGSHGEPAHDDIARCAYWLWEQQGRPQNQDVAIWLQAETQLRQAQPQHVAQA
jgi:Protein of unknown function (DUF2934)